MNSIKIKLSVIANSIAIFALSILSIISFYFTKDSLYQSTLYTETELLKATQISIEDFRSRNISLLNTLEKDILKLPYEALNSQDNIVNNVGAILKYYRNSGNLLAVYIGLDNGENIMSSDLSEKKNTNITINGKANNYNATTREWYKEARNSNQIYITPAYIDAISNEYCITYSKALYKDGKFIGVLGIDILLTSLQDQIARTPGNTFVFDNKDKIFAATNEALLDPSVDHSPVLNAYKAHGDNNFFSYKLNNEERLGACTKVFAYTACITESADIINKPIFKAAYIQVIALIVMISISIILLYFIVSKYLSPLAAIQTGLTSFFDFINYKTKNVSTIEVKSNDEFGQISNAINENIIWQGLSVFGSHLLFIPDFMVLSLCYIIFAFLFFKILIQITKEKLFYLIFAFYVCIEILIILIFFIFMMVDNYYIFTKSPIKMLIDNYKLLFQVVYFVSFLIVWLMLKGQKNVKIC
nr:cache domain-containing protein [Campylobacter jejuni]